MNSLEYEERVKLLLQLIPLVSEIDDFAIHGGTAINLFVLNLPRYSVDIDLTKKLITFINANLTNKDKGFLFDFEAGNSLSKHIEYQEFLKFPSVQWKQFNINKLKSDNPVKHKQGIEKLAKHLGL